MAAGAEEEELVLQEGSPKVRFFARQRFCMLGDLVVVNTVNALNPLLEDRLLVRAFISDMFHERLGHVCCQLFTDLLDRAVSGHVLQQHVLHCHGVAPLPETLIALPHRENLALELVLPSSREERAVESSHELL